MNLCLLCRWMLKKCMKFTQQCLIANEILKLSKTVEGETKSGLFLQQNTMFDLKTCNMEVHYLGPTNVTDFNGEEKEELIPDDGAVDDDDDEIPLVMLQNDYKIKRRESDSCETKIEIEIKTEPVIKEELIEDCCLKVKRKKKNKELKEGFSSRMVQETDEYVVIKLTKKEVLEELAEKTKAESYIRSPYKCEKCVKGFNYEEVLAAHMMKHTREHGTYQCDMCTQYCPSPVSLRGHIKSHTTSKRTTIQRHVKTHSLTAQHACYKCGKLFNTVESLRVHTARHDKSRRFQCAHCDKHFIVPSLLHNHVAAVHERKDYYCVECDVKFKSSESLRLHFKRAKRHRDSSSYKYECPQCPQRFITRSTLSVHLTCTHGAAKQHACDVCHRQYSNREALRAHAWRVHHGDVQIDTKT